MKPAWDQLSSEYEGSSVVIGDVDCTVHQDICSDYGVRGYPTIKYIESGGEPQDYKGGRSFDDLKKFTEETLVVACSLDNTEGCSEKELKFIDLAKSKGAEWVSKQTERLTKMRSGKMKPSLKQWIVQRLNILTQMGTASAKEEL
mmetsp:Transcript_27618/g.53661  ORF Transcript_27618/g.53661 Transcript_27618/m.53661 type:complete len:145 (+) Transcript_27618:160-594(+)